MNKILKNKSFTSVALLVALSLLLLIAEVFTYRGFLASHLPFNYLFIFLLNSFLVAYVLLPVFPLKKKWANIAIKLLTIPLFILLIAFFWMGILEELHFPNYIFSKTHVNFVNLPAVISLLVLWVLALMTKKDRLLKDKVIKPVFIWILLIFLSGMYVLTSLEKNLLFLEKNTSFIGARPIASYEEKMVESIGPVYNYVSFLESTVPEDSSIALPPQRIDQGFTGNTGIMRYFLYPRELYVSSESNLPEKVSDYVLASPGNELGTGDYEDWPDFKIESQETIYYDVETMEKITVEGDYIPDKNEFEDFYGLIKL